jgi:hypothetical protein
VSSGPPASWCTADRRVLRPGSSSSNSTHPTRRSAVSADSSVADAIRPSKFGFAVAAHPRDPDTADTGRPDGLYYISHEFLPAVLSEVGEICAGRVANWGMPPDDIFIRSLESHLAWPTDLARVFIQAETESSAAFDRESRTVLVEMDKGWMTRDPMHRFWPPQEIE